METGAITKTAATAAAPTRAIMEPKNPLFFFMCRVSVDLAATEPGGVVLKIGMAFVFEQGRVLIRVPMQIHADGPGSGERLRIGHGSLILHHVRAGASVALHHLQRVAVMVARSIEPGLIVEIGDIYHEGVTFPVAARVSVPELEIAVVSLLVHVNGADHVRVLGDELDVLGSLENLEGEMYVGEARNTGHVAMIHGVQLFPLAQIVDLLLAGGRGRGGQSAGRNDQAAPSGPRGGS